MNQKGVTDFLRAFKEGVGGDTASPDQVLSRTRTCLKCPKRKMITRGMVGSQISRVAGMFANKNRVDPKVKDYACSVCGCALLMIIPSKEEEPHKDTPDQAANRPAECWFGENVD